MDFQLTDIQEEFKAIARKFFTEKCTLEFLRSCEQEPHHYSEKLYGDIAGLGFTGLIIPEQYGGFGGEAMDFGLIIEEAGYAMVQSPLLPTVAYGIIPLLMAGTEAQKAELLPKIADGRITVTGAIAEPAAHYNSAYTAVRAKSEGTQYIVNGRKLFVPFAASADYLLTVVRTSGTEGEEAGLTVLLIDRQANGIAVRPIPTISDGLWEVTFSDTAVSTENIIGTAGEGIHIIRRAAEMAAALQNIETAAVLRRAVDLTTAYVQERHQFNVPIASFQSVQHRLADMFTIAEAGRLAAYSAYSKLTSGEPAHRELAIAKAWLSSEGQHVVTGAHQLHGGMGLDYDYPLPFAFRRYKASQLASGTAETHFDTLIRGFVKNEQAKIPTV